ncbi:MAG: cytochrome c3 family protein [Pseudomonadota bacterium]
MMFNRNEKIFTIALLAVCVALAALGFSSSATLSPPKKVWFDSAGGDVIFDHAYHAAFVNCKDCHHDFDEASATGATEMNCRACHYYGEARDVTSDDPTHKRFIGANCIECHKSKKINVQCDSCHIRQGFAYRKSGRTMPPLPDTVKFNTDGGLVTFNHKVHMGEDVGEPCLACHHEFKGGEAMKGMSMEKNCRACHYKLADKIPEGKDDNHVRYIGMNCARCHDGKDCSLCHKD